MKTDEGHNLFNSGNETSRKNGVGFLVNKNIHNSVSDFRNISDRLSVLKIKGNQYNIVIINVYMPTTDAIDEEVEHLYNQIRSIIRDIPKRDLSTMTGDYNAKIGELNSEFPGHIGRFTIGKCNNRGIKLAKFCAENGLVITNSTFTKRRKHTWTSPDKKTKNPIDYIMVMSNHTKLVTDASVLNIPTISDH